MNCPPQTMNTITIPSPSTYIPPSPSTVTFHPSFPVPTPSPAQLLLQIHAVAITPHELTWPTSPYPSPRIPAHGICATILSSPSSSKFSPGDRVFGLLDFREQGGMAEYAVSDEKYLAKIPDDLGFVEAASLPRAYLTAIQGLEWVRKGMRVLVTGASGAVGRMAVQILKEKVGVDGMVVAVGGRGVEGLGLEGMGLVVDYRVVERWEDVVRGEGVLDGVFDCVGGETLGRCEGLIREGGWMVSVASPPPKWAKRGEDKWKVVDEEGLKKYFYIVEESGEQLEEVGRLVKAGIVKPSVAFVVEGLTLDGGRDAWTRGLKGGLAGSIVVKVL